MTFCSNETIHIVVYAETIQKLEVVKSLRERPKKEKPPQEPKQKGRPSKNKPPKKNNQVEDHAYMQ